MIWWLLRKGPTRSHSELGRETFLRQWYFGLSRGRVGNCQIFFNPYTLLIHSLLYIKKIPPLGGFFILETVFFIVLVVFAVLKKLLRDSKILLFFILMRYELLWYDNHREIE